MADVIKEYAIQISIQGNKAVIKEFKAIDAQVQKGTKNLDKQNKALDKTNSLLWTYAKRLVGIYAIYKMIRKGINLGVSFAEQGNALSNMATVANISTRSLQKWGYALKRFGGDEKSVASTMSTINQKLYEQKYGKEPFREFVERYYKRGDIGILKSKSAEEFLLQIARKMEQYSSADDKLGIGRSLGLDDSMIAFLMQGYKAVAQQLKDAQVLYSDADIQRAKEAKKVMVEFNQALAELQLILAKGLLPFLTNAMKNLIRYIDNPMELLKDMYHNSVFGKLYDEEFSLLKKVLGTDKGKEVASKVGVYLGNEKQNFLDKTANLEKMWGALSAKGTEIYNNITMYVTGSSPEETANKVVQKQNDITTATQRQAGGIS